MQRSPDIQTFLTQILTEDIGTGDITSSAVIDDAATAHYHINAREALVVSGINLALTLFSMMDEGIEVKACIADGSLAKEGDCLLEVRGPALGILAAERTALNMLQHLSGIATLTARFRQRLDGLPTIIADTRKTIPGLRELQKYAVRCGGGSNHRLGLDTGVMIKDNHITLAGGIATAVARAKAATPLLTKIEVECDTIEQVREAITAGADQILLDNMGLETLKEAVNLCKAAHITTEASGNVSFDTIRPIAETGVDIISIGKLTHSAPAVDIGMDVAG